MNVFHFGANVSYSLCNTVSCLKRKNGNLFQCVHCTSNKYQKQTNITFI